MEIYGILACNVGITSSLKTLICCNRHSYKQ